jgi:hypothetical protein
VGDDWTTTAVNGQTKYWIRISTSQIPNVVAECYYATPANSVPGLLALSTNELFSEEWAFCSYGSSIYVTIRNTGNTAYEGNFYVTSSSSVVNKKNFFVYNHQFTADYEDSGYAPGLPEYADNSAAVTAGLSVGNFYRTGDIVKVVH